MSRGKGPTEQKKRKQAHDAFHAPSATIILPASQIKVATSLQYSLWGAVLLGQEGLDQEDLITAILKDPYAGSHHMGNIPIEFIDSEYHQRFIQYVTRDYFKKRSSDESPAYNSNKYTTFLSGWKKSLQDDIRKKSLTHKIEDIIKENEIVAEIRAAIGLSIVQPKPAQNFDKKAKPVAQAESLSAPSASSSSLGAGVASGASASSSSSSSAAAAPSASAPSAKPKKEPTLQDKYIRALALQIETGKEGEALELLKAIAAEEPRENKSGSKNINPENEIIIEANLHLANKYNDLGDQAKAKKLPKKRIDKFYEEANQYLIKAMEMGSDEAAFGLAKNYYEGRTAKKDDGVRSEMIAILEKLAKNNHAQAINLLSIIHHDQSKTNIDQFKHFQTISDSDSPESQFNLSCFHAKQGDMRRAFICCEKSALQGFAAAQNNLAAYYLQGLGVKANPETAFEWFKRSAEQGFSMAQHNLAYCYDKAIGVDKNLKMAVKFYRKAANQGYVGSLHNMGVFFDTGLGVVQDLQMATEFYLKAIEQGFEESNIALAAMTIYDVTDNPAATPEKQNPKLALVYMLLRDIQGDESRTLQEALGGQLRRLNGLSFVYNFIDIMDNYLKISGNLLKQLKSLNHEEIMRDSESLIADVGKILLIFVPNKQNISNPLIIKNLRDISATLSPILNPNKDNATLNVLEAALFNEDLEKHLEKCRDKSGRLQKMFGSFSEADLRKSLVVKPKLSELLTEITTEQFREFALKDKQILGNLKLLSAKLSPIFNADKTDGLFNQLEGMISGKLPSSVTVPKSKTDLKGKQDRVLK